jgi:hypothetical protein
MYGLGAKSAVDLGQTGIEQDQVLAAVLDRSRWLLIHPKLRR